MVLDELDALLTGLQRRQLRPLGGVNRLRRLCRFRRLGRPCGAAAVGIADGGFGPVGVDRLVLAHRVAVAKVGAAGGGGVPAGKIPAAAAGGGEAVVGAAQRVAQNGVVVQAAAVAVEDHIAEGHLVGVAVVAVIEEQLDFPQAAVEGLLGEGAALFDPGAESVGDFQICIAAAGDDGLHLVVAGQNGAAVVHHQIHQGVKLLLCQAHAFAGDEAVDGGGGAGQGVLAVAAVHHLADKGAAPVADGIGLHRTGGGTLRRVWFAFSRLVCRSGRIRL